MNDSIYLQFRKMISKLVKSHQLRYGGEYSDLLSVAHVAFAQAVHTHNPTKASLGTWIYQQVKYRLIDYLRENCKQVPTKSVAFDALPCHRSFDLDSLLSEVSHDAASIIKLALESPGEMVQCQGSSTNQHRSALVNTLMELGWCGQRIAESFQEIREAITS